MVRTHRLSTVICSTSGGEIYRCEQKKGDPHMARGRPPLTRAAGLHAATGAKRSTGLVVSPSMAKHAGCLLSTQTRHSRRPASGSNAICGRYPGRSALRRRVWKPIPANPKSIMAQVAGSGTAAVFQKSMSCLSLFLATNSSRLDPVTQRCLRPEQEANWHP